MSMVSAQTDPRKRKFVLLGGVAAGFVLLAVAAVFQQSLLLAPKFQPKPMFPDLAKSAGSLNEIIVTAKDGAFHIKMTDGKWVIQERGNFPAELALVRAATDGLDRKSTRLNSSHVSESRMPSSA